MPEDPRVSLAETLRELPEITSDLVFVVDRKGNAAWANAAMEGWLASNGALERHQVLEWLVSLIDRLPPISGEGDLVDEDEGRLPVISVSDALGRPEWFEVQVFPTVFEDRPARSIILHDVTALKNREMKLLDAHALIEHRLNHDAETGLPSGRKFTQRLKRALRLQDDEERVGIVVFDLDRFEEMRQVHGPDAGEQVLQEVAVGLMENVQDDQVVARIGTARFAVLYQEVRSRRQLLDWAEELREALDIVVQLDTGPFPVLPRAAVVFADPEEAEPERLLRDAEIALSNPRLPGGAQIRAYSPDMRKQLERRARTYNELREGLRREEIEPFFQPLVSLGDRSVMGMEVLARWNHPTEGLVPPGIFLEISQQTGLLTTIEDIVLRKGLAVLSSWRDAGVGPVRLSFNLSQTALQDPGLLDRVTAEIESQSVDPASVAFELSETMATTGPTAAITDTIEQLRDRGFGVVLDNFGGAFASIESLVRLNADTVKIDRKLIGGMLTSPKDRAVVERILQLAGELGVATVAEGIESDLQMNDLATCGCGQGQGYHIARPMSGEDAARWMTYKTLLNTTEQIAV